MSINLDHIDPGNAGGSVRIPQLPPVVAEKITWSCDECDSQFIDREDLRVHKLEIHPLKRPSVHVQGLPASTMRFRIVGGVAPNAFHFENVDTIQLSGETVGSLEEAVKQLCGVSRGRIQVRLGFRGYITEYDFIFDVLSDAAAYDIERSFTESSAQNSLKSILEAFNSRVASVTEGRFYIAGLQAYITGLMAKDNVQGAVITGLDFKDKMGEALDALEYVKRPFAQAMCSLIRFILNQLAPHPGDQYFPFLAHLKGILTKGDFGKSENKEAESAYAIPLDALTETLHRFANLRKPDRLSRVARLENLLKADSLSGADKIKLRLVLLAVYQASNDKVKTSEHFKELAQLPSVGRYAEALVDASL